MKLKGILNEIRYDATFNKGNYENEKIGLSYQPTEGEDVFVVIEELKAITKGERTLSATKEEAKIVKVEVGTSIGETIKQERAEKEPVLEEPKEVKEPKKKRNAAAPASKVTLYDRASDVHKKRLAEWLDVTRPSWKSGENLKKAVAVSKELSGNEPFLDDKGVLLTSFQEKFISML